MSKAPRIGPISPDKLGDDAVRDVLGALHGRENWRIGATKNLPLTLAHHPSLGLPYLKFGRAILMESSLSDRLRELVTLRVGHLYKSDYEWINHVILGQKVGLTLDEIAATKIGADAPGWSELDRLGLRAVDELHRNTTVSDETWQGLAAHLDQKQIIELLFTIGHYVMVAMVMNAVGLQVEPDQIEVYNSLKIA